MWWTIVTWVISFAALYLLRPDVETPEVEQVERPKTDQGELLGVLLGSHWIDGANVVWYGDLDTEPVYADDSKK